MTPLLLVVASLVALGAGVITLRSFGPRYRVARLLATTPRVTVAEAIAIARDGPARYVRVDGRIDADEEFEDADHRPLVFRRTRFEARSGAPARWSAFEDSREAVEFEIREGLDGIRVDTATLDVGLVVVPRHSVGVAADISDRAPPALDPATPIRAVIEQISSVEHAIVLGVPVSAGAEGGAAHLTAGLGKPLVLSTLEPDEAMRILAGGSTRPRVVAACFLAGTALLIVGLAWAGLGAVMSAVIPIARAASPSPGTGGDPRSSGEGPGLVGEPLLALVVVAGIAVLAVVLTTLYVRVTDTKPGKRS